MARVLKYLIIYSVFIFLLTACYSVRHIDIDVLEPAEKDISSDIISISLINRASIPPFGAGSTKIEITDITNLPVDSVASGEFLRGVANVLTSSPRFDFNPPVTIANKTSSIPSPMTSKMVKAITDSAGTDAVLSLEYYKVTDSLWVEYVPVYYTYESILRYINTSIWRLYVPSNQDYLQNEIVQYDTLYWTVYGSTSEELSEGLPDKVSTLLESCYTAGEKFGFTIAPVWVPVTRSYYISSSGPMKEAAELAQKNEWENAATIWKEIAESANKEKAARAAYNIALSYEIQDKLDEAIEWAYKSYLFSENPSAKRYFDLLIERRENKKKILQQY